MKPILLSLTLMTLAGVSFAAVRVGKPERLVSPRLPLQTTVTGTPDDLGAVILNGSSAPAVYEPALVLLYSQPQALKRRAGAGN